MFFSKSRSGLSHPDDVIDSIDHSLSEASRDRWAPVAYAGGMLAIGAGLLIAQPRVGHVPDPAQAGDAPRNKRLRRAAQVGRDGARAFAPSNVTDSIGRSLLVGGVALIMTRVLDELSGHDGD